ncbi:TRAP transporter substrate-binding protein [Nitratireductor soli]|uniref:TRAP transporter substrate-binding protein n=1 Tax=Nitratireductor soli TaxID=1670619 RepID=UPI00065DF567|nr:TRAP transporter substrate-binding protein [Nitratireductor soli]
MKKQIVLGLIAGLMAVSGAMAQEIRIGVALPKSDRPDDFINGMYERFEQEVEANSDMTVEISYGGALGAPNERLNQMRRGVIQMSDSADGNYATIFPDIQILNLPYLFANDGEVWTLLDGPVGDELAEDMRAKTGIRVLGWWTSGSFKQYSANKPIRTPDDMKGLKMRVLGPLATIPVEALGASPAPISFAELYTALRTGVVDGQDNAAPVFVLVKLYEVQKHLSLTSHSFALGAFGINDAFYSGLDADKKKVIDEAAAKAIAFNREASLNALASALKTAGDNGTEVIDLDQAARDAFKAIAQPPAIEWLKENVDTPERVDAIVKAVEEARN